MKTPDQYRREAIAFGFGMFLATVWWLLILVLIFHVSDCNQVQSSNYDSSTLQ